MSAAVEDVAVNKRWAAGCDDCGCITVIDGDGKEVDPEEDWDEFPRCLVCGGSLSFDGYGQSMWEYESWLMKNAATAVKKGIDLSLAVVWPEGEWTEAQVEAMWAMRQACRDVVSA